MASWSPPGRSSTDAGGEDMILARFDSEGALDTSYGINGVTTADFGTGDIAPQSSGVALVQQADGKYVAVGRTLSVLLALLIRRCRRVSGSHWSDRHDREYLGDSGNGHLHCSPDRRLDRSDQRELRDGGRRGAARL